MNRVVLVEGLEMLTADGKLTGTELKEKLSSIPMNKSNAIKLLAFNAAMKDLVAEAKDYLIERCADSGSYIDNVTGLGMTVTSATRTTVTSDKIEEYKSSIKKETELIKKGIKRAGAQVIKTPYKRWSLIK
jgi:hypothetical protein